MEVINAPEINATEHKMNATEHQKRRMAISVVTGGAPYIAYGNLWVWRDECWTLWSETFIDNEHGGSSYLNDFMGCSSYFYDFDACSIKQLSSGNYEINGAFHGTIVHSIRVRAVIASDGTLIEMEKM